jgi:hypothetical protein
MSLPIEQYCCVVKFHVFLFSPCFVCASGALNFVCVSGALKFSDVLHSSRATLELNYTFHFFRIKSARMKVVSYVAITERCAFFCLTVANSMFRIVGMAHIFVATCLARLMGNDMYSWPLCFLRDQ